MGMGCFSSPAILTSASVVSSLRSLVVTTRRPSWHLTWSENETEHLEQKSGGLQSHSCVYVNLLMSGVRSGSMPRRCARNSSCSTVELSSTSTRSIASVGVSAIITRRSALARLMSVLV